MTNDDYDDQDDDRNEEDPGWADLEPREGCVLGDRCCCPHMFHSSDECYTAEWAAEYFGAQDAESAPELASEPAPEPAIPRWN